MILLYIAAAAAAVCCEGSFRHLRESLGPWCCSVQDTSLRPDGNARQHYVHTDRHERRPIPRYLSSTESRIHFRSDVTTESDDMRRLARGARVCDASTLHFQTSSYELCCLLNQCRCCLVHRRLSAEKDGS